MKQVKYLWVSYWIINSRDLFKKTLIHPVIKQAKHLSESMNHSFKRFVQKHWFIQSWNKWSIYEWVNESLIQEICSKTLIHPVMKQVKYLWLSYWIINSRDLFKNTDSSSHETSEVFMSELLNH